MAMVEAAVGLAFMCSSIAVMLRQVDKTTGSTPYDRDRLLAEQDRLEAEYRGSGAVGQKGGAAGRKAFEVRDYVSRLSPEIAMQFPERKSKMR